MQAGHILPKRVDMGKYHRQKSIELDYDSVERRYTFDGSKEVKSWLDNLEESATNQLIAMTERHHYRQSSRDKYSSYESKRREKITKKDHQNLLKLKLEDDHSKYHNATNQLCSNKNSLPSKQYHAEGMFGKKNKPEATVINIDQEREWLRNCK